MQEIKIEDAGFSARTYRGLKMNFINYISEVMDLSNEDLFSLRGLNDKNRKEIITYQQKNRTKSELKVKNELQTQDTSSNAAIKSYVTQAIISYFQDDIILYGNGLGDALKLSIENNMDTISINSIDSIEHALNNSSTLIPVLKSEYVITWIKQCIMTLLANTHVISKNRLQQEYPRWTIEYGILDEALSELTNSMQIEKVEGLYRKKLPYLNEWLTSLDSKSQAIMEMRLSGKTLQECAEYFHVSRERIRQIQAKSLRKKHYTVREDEYEYWFKKYKFSDISWEEIFNLDKKSYYFFKIQYDEGTKELEDILQDEKMDAYLYPRVKKYLSKTYVSVDGEYIPFNKSKIALKLAKKYHSDKEITMHDFLNEYNLFLIKNHLENHEELIFPSERAFEGLLQRSDCILIKYGKRLRYYPLYKYDITELVDAIHLDNYRNIEISTKKILDDYPDVMELFNIRDEYELHNLLKKTESIWNPYGNLSITITRTPFITFGVADRAEQAENILFQIAPVTAEEFGQYYEMEYGVLARTAIANMSKYIDQYYHNGIYSIDQPLFNELEMEYMENALTNEFYLWNDVQDIYTNQFGTSKINRLNARNMKSLGFKVYNGYIIDCYYPSADNYFYNLVLENDLFDLSELDSRMIYVRTFSKVLNELRSSFKILEYADKKYIRFDRFNKILDNETPQTLLNYIDKAIRYSNQKQYFTMRSLKADGFKDDYDNLGFGDWFSSALIKNSKKIKYLKVGGNILFYK